MHIERSVLPSLRLLVGSERVLTLLRKEQPRDAIGDDGMLKAWLLPWRRLECFVDLKRLLGAALNVL